MTARFNEISKFLQEKGLRAESMDDKRPWGGFFVIANESAGVFLKEFYPEIDHNLLMTNKISPKILMVKPGTRLSWQYHHRRAELWKLIQGKAGYIASDTDQQGSVRQMEIGKTLTLPQGQRHRLVGLDEWGIVAEIWQHTDPDNPSDEDDIVRLEDDFGRGDNK